MKRILTTTAVTAALALSTAMPLTAQDAQLSGTVTEIFGNQMIVDTAEGRILVTPPEHADIPAAGTRIDISGTRDGSTLAATALTIAAASAPADTSLPAALRGLGLTDIRSRSDDEDIYYFARMPDGGWLRAETERGRLKEVQTDGANLPESVVMALLPQMVRDAPRLVEIARMTEIDIDDDGEISVEGFAQDGMRIEMEFDQTGALRDVERERDDRRSLSAEDARAKLEALGYTQIGFMDRGGRHIKAVAVNPYGDQVEVRLDDTGRVDRERMWMR